MSALTRSRHAPRQSPIMVFYAGLMTGLLAGGVIGIALAFSNIV